MNASDLEVQAPMPSASAAFASSKGGRALQRSLRGASRMIDLAPDSRALQRRFSSRTVQLGEVPVIDLGPTLSGEPPRQLVNQMAQACQGWGFFQVVNHGLDESLRSRFEVQMPEFFNLPAPTKRLMKRDSGNARGWYDDEFTKQRRDWKQGLDIGVPASRSWRVADGDPSNANLDGFNRFPPTDLLPDFRSTTIAYFEAATRISERLALIMALGLGLPPTYFSDQLRDQHTSYLRMNFYPPCADPGPPGGPPPLGISPHKDAGFLTVLAQDEHCHSLQVRRRTDNEWVTVKPIPGALTINTGDMAQIWSNDRCA
jgi:isopenicillin N synthase-like dioxygenase